MVIYEKRGEASLKEAENIKTVARLRNYLNSEGVLISEGVNILIQTLLGFKEIIKFHQVSKIYCVATATIRQSKNQQEIIRIVKEKTGFNMKILTEQEEAFYGFYAVSHSTSVETGVTIDIGGGSTEITYFKNRKLMYFHSFPFGVVSLKEQFMKHDIMTQAEEKELTAFILQSLEQLPWLKNLQVPVIAIGGSARNIAQIDQNLKKYPIAGTHQYIMTLSDLSQIQFYLKSMTIAQLEKVEGLSKDRADIIIPALEVFVQLCNYCQSSIFLFSRKGLRDGISMEKIENSNQFLNTDQIISKSIAELIADYHVDPSHAIHTGKLAKQLFAEISRICKYENMESLEEFIIRGAQIYYLGEFIDDDASSQHTFYLLANQSINGLNHKERVTLAFIASFKNKPLLKQYMSPFENWFSKEEMEDIRVGGAIAKLASALDSSKRSIVKRIAFEKTGTDSLTLVVYSQGNAFVEQYETGKHIRQLEKALNKTIGVKFVSVDLSNEEAKKRRSHPLINFYVVNIKFYNFLTFAKQFICYDKFVEYCKRGCGV